MNSLTPENRGNNLEELASPHQVAHDCGDILMSFLDDNQILDEEDWDDERLTTVMRSLEAEIHVQQVAEDKKNSLLIDQENSSDSNILNFNWMDTEMEMDGDHDDAMDDWYMHAISSSSIGHGLDYFHERSDSDILYEDHEHGSYATLWQEINYMSMVHG